MKFIYFYAPGSDFAILSSILKDILGSSDGREGAVAPPLAPPNHQWPLAMDISVLPLRPLAREKGLLRRALFRPSLVLILSPSQIS